MICKNCGNEMPDSAKYCPSCGSVAESSGFSAQNVGAGESGACGQPFQPSAGVQYGPAPYNGQSSFGADAHEASEISSAKTYGIISIILAVVGFNIVAIILGAIGISKMNSVPLTSPNAFAAAEAKRLCRIGLILGIVFAVVIAVVIIALIAMFTLGVVALDPETFRFEDYEIIDDVLSVFVMR